MSNRQGPRVATVVRIADGGEDAGDHVTLSVASHIPGESDGGPDRLLGGRPNESWAEFVRLDRKTPEVPAPAAQIGLDGGSEKRLPAPRQSAK
ncbi:MULTISPECIES: hypothetical protein [unclassified Bradyrhizobium]|uniref:hypothetical protein n=1 Tax=unclassified Bradyrhizobium TaxID=2631580 RepID=UPI002479BE44|nr:MULTISPECIES: hypothetical protein [unclassified Bradyrhizobium]WGR71315.1 hypothetical protein MTX24_39450 [Bradyrhizobium sp. ISRA426]WGR76150.1 hypothetical protein MTX21_24555 [Bradyrhizobium sp. ISRA430]WGR86555.1 hypothetical protein MTX25_39140 [Bradyrhizobium sp. ISRA432]